MEPDVMELQRKIQLLENLGCVESANALREHLNTLLSLVSTFTAELKAMKTDSIVLEGKTFNLTEHMEKNILKIAPGDVVEVVR
jgi:hypothetical protein